MWWTLAQGGRFGILPTDAAYPDIVNFAAASLGLEQTVTCPSGNPLLSPQFVSLPNCPAG